MNIAYADIRAAFMSHARDFPDRPLVLAGFSQGAELALRLLMEFFDEPSYQDRLVAAYIIGWRVTPEDVPGVSQHLKMAKGEEDTGVIVSFNSESEHISSSLFVPAGGRHTASTTNLEGGLHPGRQKAQQGACFTDYTGTVKREIPALTGARIDPGAARSSSPTFRKNSIPVYSLKTVSTISMTTSSSTETFRRM